MPTGTIPLFPLQVVVFPRTRLPLHIFEERYKEMVGKAIREQSEFGVVLAKDDGIVNAGCTVTVDRVTQRYADGRMDIVTRGRRRFEILSLSQEKSYLQAEVNYFDDEDAAPPPAELKERALAGYRELSQLDSSREAGDADLADPQLSFQLAQAVRDPDFLHTLLQGRSEAGRLKELVQYLTEYIPRQRAIERVRDIAPTNGHGGRPAGL